MTVRQKRTLALLACLLPATAQAEEPRYLNITFVGAAMGPKAGGEKWDGLGGPIDANAASAVGLLVSGGLDAGMTGAAVANATNLLGSGTSAPDVAASVSCQGPTHEALKDVAGVPVTLTRKEQDTYTPQFNVTYENWPVYGDTYFDLRMWDIDLTSHDPMGTVRINIEHLQEALAAKKVLMIPVADQSNGQILAINLAVTAGQPWTEEHKPRIDGTPW